MANNPNDLDLNERPIGNLYHNSARKIINKNVELNTDPESALSGKEIRNAFVNSGEEVTNEGIRLGNQSQTSRGNKSKPQERYNLKKKRPDQMYRGAVLVLSYEEFENKHNNRPGNAADVAKIYSIFIAQGFEVIEKRNKTKDKTWNFVQKESNNPKYKDYSCFIMVILSHGKENEFLCADGQYMEYRKIFDLFQNADSLVGKPKLYFIQACQGNANDHGQEMVFKDNEENKTLESDIRESENPNPNIHPKYADTLEFYCSYSGFKSFRKPLSGSWFIQTLCEKIHEFAKEELKSILQRVIEAVSSRDGKDNDGRYYKQLPTIRQNTLRKDFYF